MKTEFHNLDSADTDSHTCFNKMLRFYHCDTRFMALTAKLCVQLHKWHLYLKSGVFTPCLCVYMCVCVCMHVIQHVRASSASANQAEMTVIN